MCVEACDGAGLTTECGGCVRLATSPRHCGRCGNVCGFEPNTVSPCVDGACVFTCRGGFLDCNGDRADGCETNVYALPPDAWRCPASGDAGAGDAGAGD